MNIVLWVLQILLAAAFGLFGFSKALYGFRGADSSNPGKGQTIGGLPEYSWPFPGLLGTKQHQILETYIISFNAVLGVLAAVVAWGCWSKA